MSFLKERRDWSGRLLLVGLIGLSGWGIEASTWHRHQNGTAAYVSPWKRRRDLLDSSFPASGMQPHLSLLHTVQEGARNADTFTPKVAVIGQRRPPLGIFLYFYIFG